MAMYSESKKYLDAYKPVEELGEGGTGLVMKCISKVDGQEYAVKIIDEYDWIEEEIEKEVFICQQLDHRNIVKLIEAFRDEKIHYLVFEIMAGGDLFDDIATRHKFSEYDACHCIEQVLKGVEYLHDKKIIHRDLKPRNILLTGKGDKAIVKIADFGSAVMQEREDMDRFPYYFTFYYGAPEAHKEEDIGPPVDMWTCGMLLYVTLVGKHPFGKNDEGFLIRIYNAEYSFDDDDSSDPVCDAAKDLISKLLVPDQTKRYTAKAALAHSFIRDHTQVASRFHRSMTIDNMKVFNVVKRKIKSDMFPKASVAGLKSPPKSKSDGAIVDKTLESASDVAVSGTTGVGRADEANQESAATTAISTKQDSTAGASVGSESEKSRGGVSSSSREDA